MLRRLRPWDTSGHDGPRGEEGGLTIQPNQITEVLNRSTSRELLARDLTRLAYIAKDGTPRTIPIAFTWNGAEIVMCTAKNAPKLAALRQNPAVALTIDTEVHPPKILLIRGRAGDCHAYWNQQASELSRMWRWLRPRGTSGDDAPRDREGEAP